jgi:hypothetical protein
MVAVTGHEVDAPAEAAKPLSLGELKRAISAGVPTVRGYSVEAAAAEVTAGCAAVIEEANRRFREGMGELVRHLPITATAAMARALAGKDAFELSHVDYYRKEWLHLAHRRGSRTDYLEVFMQVLVRESRWQQAAMKDGPSGLEHFLRYVIPRRLNSLKAKQFTHRSDPRLAAVRTHLQRQSAVVGRTGEPRPGEDGQPGDEGPQSEAIPQDGLSRLDEIPVHLVPTRHGLTRSHGYPDGPPRRLPGRPSRVPEWARGPVLEALMAAGTHDPRGNQYKLACCLRAGVPPARARLILGLEPRVFNAVYNGLKARVRRAEASASPIRSPGSPPTSP